MLHLYTVISALFNADHKEEGATATEYALIIAGIAVAIVAAIGLFGGALETFWTNLGGSLGI